MAAVLPGLTMGEFPELWKLNEMGGWCRSMRTCLTISKVQGSAVDIQKDWT